MASAGASLKRQSAMEQGTASLPDRRSAALPTSAVDVVSKLASVREKLPIANDKIIKLRADVSSDYDQMNYS